MSSVLIRNAHILTMNDAFDAIAGDVWIQDGRIASVGAVPRQVVAESTIDAAGSIVLPGFVQTHVHLCQTLFRGLAEDLPLLEWLHRRVWPLEAAHDPVTLAAAARLAAAELQLGGTTTALTMETVHDTDAVFEALIPTGLRATVGKCLMDVQDQAPARLAQSTTAALDESVALHRRWHGAAGGRLRAAFAPRFALSCTRDLLEQVAALSARDGILVHTHAAEQQAEIDLVRRLTGRDNLEYFDDVGLATPALCVAHCVWTSERERDLLAERRMNVLHCPTSNLKLGSGVAPVVEFRRRGIGVSLGADGAACNNTLDMFQEMRLAALLQAMRHGPGALAARDVVAMATRGGARALGLDADIGSVEPGKKADLIVIAQSGAHQTPAPDPYATVVFASRPADVRLTMIDGIIVARDRRLAWEDEARLARDGARAAATLRARAGL